MFSRKVLGLTTFAFAFAALMAPGTAHASKARSEALHVPSQYTVDRVNVQFFPTSLYRNQNMIFGELGVWDEATGSDFNDPESPSELEDADRSLGMYMGNLWEGRAGVFGFELNENGGALSPTHGSEFVNRNLNEAIAVYWAQQFGKSTFGLKFDRMYSKFEDKTVGNEGSIAPYDWFGTFLPFLGGSDSWELFTEAASAFGSSPMNSIGFGAGLSFENQGSSGNTRMFEFSAEARKYTFKLEDVPSLQTLENDNSMSFAANARGMLQANQSLTWVPYVGFASTDLGWAFTDGNTPANNTSADNKMTNFEGGVAGNWTLRQNDMLVAGAAFKTSKIEWKDASADTVTIKYTQPVCLFAGFEGNMFSWMTIRFGASKPIFADFKIEDPNGNTSFGATDESQVKDSPFNFNIGTGFHFGNVTVDAVLNQDYAFSGGPLAASGDDGTIYPFSRLSVTYRY